MNHFGATKEEWAHWDLVLGLSEDLLPAVCKPGCAIAPSSKLESYGKVPTVLDHQGRVMGMPAWTSHVTTDAEISRWSAQPEYGICVQTRTVRALDVDVTNALLANYIDAFMYSWSESRGHHFPVRRRANSPKFLVLFELEGDYAKQTLRTDCGIIEFLASGQQCLVSGVHPSGSRYVWDGGLPSVIPTLTAAEFAALRDALACTFGEENLVTGERATWSEPRRTVARGSQPAITLDALDDPVVGFLKSEGVILDTSPDGRVHVTCPWEASHTTGTDQTATTYFPAGTGNSAEPGFRCLHGHCQDKHVGHFFEAIGWTDASALEGFEALEMGITERDALAAFGAEEDLIGRDPRLPEPVSPIAMPRFERDTKSGKIKPLLNNLLLWLRWRGATSPEQIRFDVFKDRLMVCTPTVRRALTDTDYTRLQAEAEYGDCGFSPLKFDLVRRAIHKQAEEDWVDSIQEWVDTLPEWDGVHRVDTFVERYLGAAPSPYARAVSRYQWSAMMGRILDPGAQTDMVLILVSEQGTGKSSAVRAMAPSLNEYIEISLSDNEENLCRLTKGKVLIELAELRGLKTKEMETIKAFVTRREGEYAKKYVENPTMYKRRFLMIGTTNDEEILSDATGSRRWLPIRVGVQDVAAIKRDHAQLWAEAKALYRKEGICWSEAQSLASEEHTHFEMYDSVAEDIARWLRTPDLSGRPPSTREFLQVSDIMREVYHAEGVLQKRTDQMRIADALKKLHYARTTRRVNGHPMKVWVGALPTVGGNSRCGNEVVTC